MRKPGGVWEETVPVTNEELALAFQLGDVRAGEELLRNVVEGLIRHQASKMCRDDSLLEDLLQEGRAAALAATGKYDYPFYHIRFAKDSGGYGGVSGKGRPAGFHASGPVSPAAAGG